MTSCTNWDKNCTKSEIHQKWATFYKLWTKWVLRQLNLSRLMLTNGADWKQWTNFWRARISLKFQKPSQKHPKITGSLKDRQKLRIKFQAQEMLKIRKVVAVGKVLTPNGRWSRWNTLTLEPFVWKNRLRLKMIHLPTLENARVLPDFKDHQRL